MNNHGVQYGQVMNHSRLGYADDEYTAAEAAKAIGVSRKTLMNMLGDGRIPEPDRNWRGYRIFTQQHIEAGRKHAKR